MNPPYRAVLPPGRAFVKPSARHTVASVRNTEADTLAELIEDCTELPQELRGAEDRALPEPVSATPWQVDEANYAQVEDLDVYV